MPTKSGVCRDLVRVNITSPAHKYTMKYKRHGEPFYSVYDRILSSYMESDSATLQELYDDAIRQCEGWKNRYEELKTSTQQMRFENVQS